MYLLSIRQSVLSLFLIFTLFFALTLQSDAQTDDAQSASEIVLILDASGSMWGQIEGESKISIAKQVLTDLISELPENAKVGLIAYGHRQKGDCDDIETIVEPGPLDKASINKKIEALNPKGKTPITDSVLMAFELVKASEDATTVILVSDGIETCGGDPCKAVKDAKDMGINFIMHVVGFDVGDVDTSELECAAQAGGGLYMSANNAGELSEALETAVEIPAELPVGKLTVKVTAEGKLQDARLILTNTDTDEKLKPQRTYSKPNTNPRTIPLPDGIYELEVEPLGMKGVASKVIPAIEIMEGETITQEIDFSIGELSIRAVMNGKVTDASVTITSPESEEEIAKGRLYSKQNTNPKLFKLSPGVYDVAVKALKIKNSPVTKFESLEIKSGETVEKTADFSSGTLIVGALKGEKFVEAAIYITDKETGDEVARGRVYKNSKDNPREFELLPGTYDVKAKAINIKDNPTIEFEGVQITAAESVEKTALFSSGVLKIGALDGKKFVEAMVYVTDSNTGEKVTQVRINKNSKTNPQTFELVPGVYDIRVSAINILKKPEVEYKGVEITGEGTFVETAQFPSGIIRVSVSGGGELIVGKVIIEDPVTGEELLRRSVNPKSKSSPNPLDLRMSPGAYNVIVSANKMEGKPEQSFEIELKGSETSEVKADFSIIEE